MAQPWIKLNRGRTFLYLSLGAVAVVLLLAAARPVAVRALSREVTVVDGDTVMTFKTMAKTVQAALEDAGIEVGEYDLVPGGLDTPLGKKDNVIEILRAAPVKVYVDGTELTVNTWQVGVTDILALAGVHVGPDDRVDPPLGERLGQYRRVTVFRVTYEEEVIKESIPYAKETRTNPSLEVGLSTVVQQGRPGEKTYTYRLTLEDGVLIARELIREEITQAPRNYIVATGTKNTVNIGGTTYRIVRAIISDRVTAYYPGPESTGMWADGVTRIGIPAGEGVIAVDPNVIPLRSKVYVTGYGFAIAADVGGAIRGTAIDVCFNTKEEALQWGVKRGVKVYILE
ncbi:MAG: G5 domain-containing protein [Bacillota bacterium]